MSDLLEELHSRAGIQPLLDNPALGEGKVFDGEVPSPWPDPPLYVLVYASVAWPAGEAGAANALDHQSVTCRTTWTFHCVGPTAVATRTLAMQIRQSLNNLRPTIPSRDCGLIEQTEALAPTKDETTGRPIFDQVVVYELTTVPG